MKITFLTTIAAMLFTLPAFGFYVGDSLGKVLNPDGKTDQPQNLVFANQPESASESASDAAVSESADIEQQGLSGVDKFLNGISAQPKSSPDESETGNPTAPPPSAAPATGGGCKKNEQGEIVC